MPSLPDPERIVANVRRVLGLVLEAIRTVFSVAQFSPPVQHDLTKAASPVCGSDPCRERV